MGKAGIALIFSIVLSGCQKPPPDVGDGRAPGLRQKITVATIYYAEGALVHAAMAKGYFADEGLDVELSIHTSGKAALQALVENKADLATVAQTPIMFDVLKGQKLFVIANVSTSNATNAVVARRGAGIAAPANLKGKRVAFTPGTTSDIFLDSLLAANGLTRRDIEPVALKPEEMGQYITAREIDAASTWSYPLTQISEQLGSDAVIFHDPDIFTTLFNVAAQQDFVRKNPETVRHFLRALIKAEDFVDKHPEEAQAIVATATKMDKSIVQKVWPSFRFSVTLDQTLLIALEDDTRWAMKNHLTDQTRMPDYREYIHVDSLRDVAPSGLQMKR